MSDVTSSRPPVERPQSEAPGGQPAPLRDQEIQELAELLAQVVELARSTAIFPGRWETIAEQAMEHQTVRAALAAGDGS